MLATIDGWGVRRTFTLGFLIFAFLTVIWIYGSQFFNDNDVEFKIFGAQVSIKRLFLNAVLNYAVFQAKQIYSMIKYPTKAGVVYASPTLNWVDDT